MKYSVENRRELLQTTSPIASTPEAVFTTLEQHGRTGNTACPRTLNRKIQTALCPDPVIVVRSSADSSELKAGLRSRPRALVIEDDASFIIFAIGVLQKCGYEGAWAKNSDDALEQCGLAKGSSSPFELVILGPITARSHCKETVNSLRAVQPRVTTLAASDELSDLPVVLVQKTGLTGVLPKRFSGSSLQTLLHPVIEAEGAGFPLPD